MDAEHNKLKEGFTELDQSADKRYGVAWVGDQLVKVELPTKPAVTDSTTVPANWRNALWFLRTR